MAPPIGLDRTGLDRTGLDGSGDSERARGSGGDFPEANIPTLAEVLAYCSKAIPEAIPEETGRAFFHHYEKIRHPAWTDDGDKRFQWEGKLGSWHRKDLEKKRGGQKPAGEKTAEQLEALLAAETDPVKRAELKAELKKAAV